MNEKQSPIDVDGTTMNGIAEVAELAGVSKSTASRALSGAGYVSPQTRARVIDAAATLGYTPSTSAQSLATGRTSSVGVVLPHVDRWFFAEVLRGVQDALLTEGLDLTLYTAAPGSAERRRMFDEGLARKRFDGIIAVGLGPDDDELDRLLRLGKPVVGIIGAPNRTSVITLDDAQTAYRATEHLLALGHRRITFLGAGVNTTWPHVERARAAGYEAAMRASGLDDEISLLATPLGMQDGYAAAVDLLSDTRHRPTAIVAACDEVAIGAIIAARRLGLQVPTSLSVVGIDDHVHAEMFALTTFQQRPSEQGATAVAMLLRKLQDPDAADETIVVKPRLIVRNSTAPASDAVPAAVADSALQPR